MMSVLLMVVAQICLLTGEKMSTTGMCFSSTASDAARAFVLSCFGTATSNKNTLSVLQILFPFNLTDPAVVNRVEKMLVSQGLPY